MATGIAGTAVFIADDGVTLSVNSQEIGNYDAMVWPPPVSRNVTNLRPGANFIEANVYNRPAIAWFEACVTITYLMPGDATPTATYTATQTRTRTPTATPTVTATTTPTRAPSLSPTATITSTTVPGSIAGLVWHDRDGDGRQTPGEPGVPGTVIELYAGGLQIGQATTLGDGTYHFASLPPGAYTVREVQPAWLRFSTTPDEVTVPLAVGQQLAVNFGDWNGWPIWLPLITR